MSDFITILESSVVASTKKGVRTTDQFQNIPAKKILTRLKYVSVGEKDGSHFLRTGLKENNIEYCMARSDNNTQSMASLLIIDCDKTLINERDEKNGAPDPYQVSEILKKSGIGHIIFGSYSYYLGLTRYRILLVTKSPYIKEQLAPTAESIVALINTNLDGNLLAYAPENGVWSQAWYYPRRPENSTQSNSLYIEYLEGNAVDVINQPSIIEINNIKREISENFGEISPIHAFNEQYVLSDLLTRYGYKLVLVTKDQERWLSPDSLSGIAGVTVKDNKFFCHHSNDPFYDGYWHDAFDLMRIKEGVTDKDAIIQAALRTRAPNGQTVDEYNKSLVKTKVIKQIKKDSGGSNNGIEDIEPFQNKIDPNQLLIDIEKLFRRVIVCNEETTVATVLWIAMTWFIDVIQVAPLAVITAPEKRCGKSQLLFFLARLVRRPLPASNITPAAMFRSIEAWSPTLLIDEADTFLRENEELRGVINCGHIRDAAYVIRTVGNDHSPYRFDVWGAKAIAGIGHLSDTIMDRAIIIELRRKLPHEKTERLRYVETSIFTDLQTKLARFALDYAELVKKARPQLPEQLNDRAQDNWEPLLAIASVVGHDWPRRAIEAAIKLSISETAPISISTELLLNIKEIIEAKKIDKISSADLIQELCVDDEQPWAAYNRGKPITPKQVASFLKKYGIKSKGIRMGRSTPKGFEKSQFNEAFSRYLTHSTELLENSRNTQQPIEYKSYNVAENNIVAATPIPSATPKPNDNNGCCGVADRLRDEGDLMEIVI